MPAYLIANVAVTDAEAFKEYATATPSVIRQYGGRFLVRGGDFEVREGEWNPTRLVVVEFESMEKAKQFYDSPEYAALKSLRQNSADTDWVFVDGISAEMAAALNSEP